MVTASAADRLAQLHMQFDQQMRKQRAAEDATLQTQMNDTTDPVTMGMAIQAKNAQSFTRGQQDMANGPSGYNRQWAGVPFNARGLAKDPTGLTVEGADGLAGLQQAAGMPDTDAEWMAKNPALKKRLTELR